MKAVKIIIVAVVLAALGYGIWRIFSAEKPKVPRAWKSEIESQCQGFSELVEAYCDSAYQLLDDGNFDGLQDCYNEVDAFYAADESVKGCEHVVTWVLNNIHREYFVAMSKKEQDNKEWPHRGKMEALCDSSMRTAGNSDSDLNRIKRGCTEYAALEAYNKKVKEQCGKNKWPSNTESKWDMNHVEKLIKEECPEANPPANHTIPYEEAQQAKQKLFDAHVAYLNSFVKKAKDNATTFPSKETWNSWSGAVQRELGVFEKKANGVYGISPTNKVKEVKTGLFAAHVDYLKALANSNKLLFENPNKKNWDDWSTQVRGELTAFENDAENTYGKSQSDVSAKAKEVKNILFDRHEAYLDARIKQDSLAIVANSDDYFVRLDKLMGEINNFDEKALNYYGKSASSIKEKMKHRVEIIETIAKAENKTKGEHQNVEP